MSQHSTGHPAPSTRSAAEAAERTAAIALWVVVGAALVYGVSETAVRVAALFA
jgi:hypothetical protein